MRGGDVEDPSAFFYFAGTCENIYQVGTKVSIAESAAATAAGGGEGGGGADLMVGVSANANNDSPTARVISLVGAASSLYF